MIALLLPTASGLLALTLTAFVCTGLYFVGAACAGRNRLPGTELLVGWAILCLPYLLLGTLTPLSFAWIDLLLVVPLLAAGAWLMRDGIATHDSNRLLILSLPFLWVMASQPPTMWDELSHWLPNAQYLLTTQHFPGLERAAPTSAHAGYPYGMPLIIYLVEMLARLMDTSVWNTGVAAIFNLLLLASAAQLLLHLLPPANIRYRWQACAVALLGVTLLNPAFVPHLVLSAYPDNATAVLFLAIAIALGTRELWTQPPLSKRVIALSLMMVLASWLREENIITVLMLAGSGMWWQWRCGVRAKALFRHMLLICMPMLCSALLWHSYASTHITQGELAMRPPAQWHTELLGAVAAGFWHTALHKSGYFLVALAIVVLAFRRNIKPPQSNDRLGAIATQFSLAFIGYNLFLALTYISTFTAQEAMRVASLWRYNTHFGLLEVAVIALALSRIKLRDSWLRIAGYIAVVAVLTGPVFAVKKLRGDASLWVQQVCQIATDINAHIPADASTAMIDLQSNGLDCVLLRFYNNNPARMPLCISTVNANEDFGSDLSQARYLWVNRWPEIADRTTGLGLSDARSHLLMHTETGWQEIYSWPPVPDKKD